ncbi:MULTISPECIES: glycoside hydrolase family 6 protein [unclassified Nocardioides]|uniref:glycoside hydrolase family 6 protein n=1 Tax=unclassified Nocardioides TaxID=2615069 RepID=UPI0009F0B61D|nr:MULTISPECIES: glycoside hydrolase family 6 protein [unclassified Nocardioides]GAW49814.1 Cellulase (Precursor) [Nocardioides sp. PD653-B2]GAW57144.1 Cellulase (Precursor) [Nocardioides sp. PD653]
MRSRVLLTLAALVASGLAVAPVEASGARTNGGADAATVSTAAKDLRKSRGLFVDPKMPGAKHGAVYKKAFGSKAQALWIIPEAYGTPSVRKAVRAYTSRALKAKKTPTLSIYGIPGRDCGGHSSAGALQNAEQYRAWIRQVGKGLDDQKALVILEPDALPFFGSNVPCDRPEGWLAMLRFASKTLSKSGAWVYIDAGHSDWRPYEQRPAQLKQAGIEFARGFSTNVSNFRSTADEKAYAQTMVTELRKLGVTGVHYVIDTSRNGAANPVNGQVINPPWARVGKPPKLVFDGAFDGTLWVKHPGESDGYENGGNSSGKWCAMLADRLIDGTSDQTSCPE